MFYAQWGLKDRLMADPEVWLCYNCNDCSVHCPRDAKPGDVIKAVRSFAFEHFAFPGFLGKVLAEPAWFPLIFMVPVLLIGALALIAASNSAEPLVWGWSGQVDFARFIPHGYIEMLFITGNILIFTFAAVGLFRFYRGMQAAREVKMRMSFVKALWLTALEILGNKRFGVCEIAKYRKLAHLLVLFGFIGTLSTTGLVFFLLIVFDVHSPFPMSHPVKWLGNASGLAIVVGMVIIIVQRVLNANVIGKANYGQWLFIWTMFITAMTGLGAQFFRIAEIPNLAYPCYFVHLVAVFILLWYAPFSQFGHMFYRTLALVFTRSVDRTPPA